MSDCKLKLSKSDLLIIQAVEAGYTATKCGKVFAPSGNEIKGSPKKGGHLSITLNRSVSKVVVTVLKHRFVYYYFHRDEMFKHQVVRHLNDIPDDNRIENLAAGSYKENAGDISYEKRIASLPENHVKDFVERCRKLSDEQVREIRDIRESVGTPYYRIAEQYGISTMTVHRLCNGVSWNTIK